MRRDRRKTVGIHGGVGTVHELDETLDDIVHIHQRDRRGRVVDLDRQVARDVVAEGGHGRVVVGPAPLAEHVGQTEDVHRNAVAGGSRLQRFFRAALAVAVRIVPASLRGRRVDDRHLLASCFCDVADGAAEALRELRVAGGEFLRVLWAVDASEVEHEVHAFQQRWQLLPAVVAGEANHLHVLALGQVQLQVLAHEATGAGNQHLHRFILQPQPAHPARCAA
ncbi:hypothetical protein FQZ97_777640 [compost metagenome]